MDQTLFFDELLQLPNLRARGYVLQELPLQGLACIEASARRGEDWFFARRWVSTRAGRRLLYWVLDEAESRGFRFRVATSDRGSPAAPLPETPWVRATEAWSGLTDEERRIHRDLFPHEVRFLESGYDWDERAVYRSGEALPRDPAGRVLETLDGVVHEWARVDEEWTWRRYPLYVTAILPASPAPRAVEAAG